MSTSLARAHNQLSMHTAQTASSPAPFMFRSLPILRKPSADRIIEIPYYDRRKWPQGVAVLGVGPLRL